ncbi:transcriptional regulatory protein FixJ [mine drainage metagenome]|uniref:Transcriptional regulatory protein FixJ n=1 Tax=mine drainage metagenome TaxID=410659 RepID=A0A1J5TD32_9ZZZZ
MALADTREAWRALEAGGVDLLVTDHHMPGNTGLELIEKLRERQVAIPSILISGNMPLSASAAARKLRGVRTMNKPFSMADLKQAIGEVMGH